MPTPLGLAPTPTPGPAASPATPAESGAVRVPVVPLPLHLDPQLSLKRADHTCITLEHYVKAVRTLFWIGIQVEKLMRDGWAMVLCSTGYQRWYV